MINRFCKVLNIHHNDFDGCVSSIVIANTFQKVQCIEANNGNVDEILKGVDYRLYDFVILTDLFPNDVSLLDLSDKLIVLDHHSNSLDYHNPKKKRWCIGKYSAAGLTKKWCEKFIKVNLSHLNSLCYLADDYDLWELKNFKSVLLNTLYFEYWAPKFRKRFFDGNTRLTVNEMKFLRKKYREFYQEYKDLQIYTFNMGKYKCGLIFVDHFINEFCGKVLSSGYDIVVNRQVQRKNNSIRTNVNDLQLGKMLQYLGIGGGHDQAAGFYEKDFSKFNDNLTKIKEYIENEI